MKLFYAIFFLLMLSAPTSASELYRITLLRAAPGNLAPLIEKVKVYKKQQKGNLSIMRHSQGDQWDLMLLEPAGKNPAVMQNFSDLADFQHSFLAKSETSWPQLKTRSDTSGLFHIEMFHAVHGQSKALLKQRQMENQYLTSTERQANSIFETTFGSDVDSFTIGYYKDLSAFAQMPDLPKATFEKAATDAGFKNRDDIGLYLRTLILSHNDTLATAVK